MHKVKQIKCDPYALIEDDFEYGLEGVPPITYVDIISYVVLTHSFYTNEQMRAYKSLAAYKYFEAGFVAKVGFLNINNLVLLVGKVSDHLTFYSSKLISIRNRGTYKLADIFSYYVLKEHNCLDLHN